MNPLERRVQTRMKVEARDRRTEQMALAHKRQKLVHEGEKALTAQADAMATLKDGGTLPLAALARVTKASRTAARILRELGVVNARMSEISGVLATLETPQEAARRVAEAMKLGVEEPLSGPDAAEIVLIQHGRPMHVNAVTDRILETAAVKLAGKTPSQTVSAYLNKEAVKPDGRFVRIAPGIFDVRRRKDPADSVA